MFYLNGVAIRLQTILHPEQSGRLDPPPPIERDWSYPASIFTDARTYFWEKISTRRAEA
jgi:hypothetical protein